MSHHQPTLTAARVHRCETVSLSRDLFGFTSQQSAPGQAGREQSPPLRVSLWFLGQHTSPEQVPPAQPPSRYKAGFLRVTEPQPWGRGASENTIHPGLVRVRKPAQAQGTGSSWKRQDEKRGLWTSCRLNFPVLLRVQFNFLVLQK